MALLVEILSLEEGGGAGGSEGGEGGRRGVCGLWAFA